MRAFLWCFAIFLLLPQCGSGGATGADAKSAAKDGSDHESSRDSSDTDEDEGPREGVSAVEKSRGLSCDDGTCSLCGSGLCPTGWYCDEKASGGGACSWLTECADKPTCGCVTRVLGSSCKCREEGGGLKVVCD